MDNEAFSSLVKERVKQKSTKEIAREVVEEEFQQKQKHSKKRILQNKETTPLSKRWKQQQQQDKQQQDKQTQSVEQYRDRAKERREGRENIDYNDTTSSSNQLSSIEKEMTKYLGGEEKYTHLVKGLDYSLAQKVRREQQQQTTTTATTNDTKKQQHDKTIVSFSSLSSTLQQSSLVTNVYSYLQQKQTSNKLQPTTNQLSSMKQQPSKLGQAIQRTTITFSLRAHPGNIYHSWQLPKESTYSQLQQQQQQTNKRNSIHFHPSFLKRIDQAFTTSTTTKNNQTNYTQPNCDTTTTTTTTTSDTKNHSQNNIQHHDDFDIFENEEEYIPPTLSKTNLSTSNNQSLSTHSTSQKTSSIFTGLLLHHNTIDTKEKQDNSEETLSTQKEKEGKQKPIIERDILGGDENKTNFTFHQQNKNGGISISTYAGGYGEETDTDLDEGFATNDEDTTNDNNTTKKKNHKHYNKKKNNDGMLTEAVKEYGSSRKK